MTQMTYIVWQWSFRDFCHAIDMKLACWKHTEIDLRHPTVTLDITWHVAISSLWYAVILCLTVQLRESSLYSGYWEPNQGVSTSVCSPNVWEPQHIKHVAKFLRTNFSVLQDFPGKAWSREVKRKHWKSNLWLSLFLFFAPDQFAMNHNESNWKIFKDTFRETPPNRRLDRSKHWRRRAQVDHLLQWNQRIHVRKAPESWQRQLDPMVDEPWVEPHPSIDPQECWGNRKKALELPAKHFHNQCSIYIYIYQYLPTPADATVKDYRFLFVQQQQQQQQHQQQHQQQQQRQRQRQRSFRSSCSSPCLSMGKWQV